MGTIGRTEAKPKDFQKALELVGAKLEAKKEVVGNKIEEAWHAMEQAPMSPLKEKWLEAVAAKKGIEKAFYTLLEEVEPVRFHELKIAFDEQKKLSNVFGSFESLCRNLRELNARGKEEEINPVLAKDQHELRTSLLSDIQAIRDGLKAAGSKLKGVGAFPMKQLGIIEKKAEADAEAILAQRDERLAKLPQMAHADKVELATVKGAAERIASVLGDKQIAADLVKAAERVPGAEKGAFLRNLAALARMADVATTALDYTTVGFGWGRPDSRLEYRMRQTDDWLMYASESRLDATHGRMFDLAKEVAAGANPNKVLEEKLPGTFSSEIGLTAKDAAGWKVTAQAVAKALEHEALIPLRALNETIVDAAMSREDAVPFKNEMKKVVRDVTRHVLEGDYREWRYTSPQSKKQLAVLSDKQRDQWMKGHSVEAEGFKGTKLKTREEDDVELMWVTKIGGPSHGFDYGPHCLLPLLANGRTKAILVEDPRWPHNAAARCYIRVLEGDDGKAMLYLEPMQRDFPHRGKFDTKETGGKESAAVRFAQIQHALEKAKQMGLPLNLSVGDDAFLDAMGVAYKPDNRKLVIEGSAGVFEASDTMFPGHDFPQTERLVTEPNDKRILVDPRQMAKE